MLEQIINYFNNNKPIGIIIVIILIILVLWLYNSQKESFDGGQTCNCAVQDETFYSQYVFGKSNLVNFKCSYNGSDYYLANMKLSNCSSQEAVDCNTSALVLMPVNDADEQLKKYLTDIQINTEICNTANKIKCLANYSSADPPIIPTMMQEEACNEPSELCNSTRMFNTDFNVIEATTSTGGRKYLIKGTAVPSQNNFLIPTLLNQSLYDSNTVKNIMCSDTYEYSPKNNPDFAEVAVVEKLYTNFGSIIGGSNPLRIKLKFTTKMYVPTTNSQGVKTYLSLSDPTTGLPNTKSTYIGICSDLICNNEGKQYPRVCLYDDATDPNVLDFEPLLV
jgi:hypothetical protein